MTTIAGRLGRTGLVAAAVGAAVLLCGCTPQAGEDHWTFYAPPSTGDVATAAPTATVTADPFAAVAAGRSVTPLLTRSGTTSATLDLPALPASTHALLISVNCGEGRFTVDVGGGATLTHGGCGAHFSSQASVPMTSSTPKSLHIEVDGSTSWTLVLATT